MASILAEAITRLRASNPELFEGMPKGIEGSPGRVLGELMRRTSYPVASAHVQKLYAEVRKPESWRSDAVMWRQAGDDATEGVLNDFMKWIDTRAYDNPSQGWPREAILGRKADIVIIDDLAEVDTAVEALADEADRDELRALLPTVPPDHKDWATW